MPPFSIPPEQTHAILEQFFQRGRELGYKAGLAEGVKIGSASAQVRTFSDNGDKEPKRVHRFIRLFDPEDIEEAWPKYFAADRYPHGYPRWIHDRFGMTEQAFADFAGRQGLTRKQIVNKNGVTTWVWVRSDKDTGKAQAQRTSHPANEEKRPSADYHPTAGAEQAVHDALENPDSLQARDVGKLCDHLDTLPQARLRELAKQMSLRVGGRKMDLIGRFLEHVRTQQTPAQEQPATVAGPGAGQSKDEKPPQPPTTPPAEPTPPRPTNEEWQANQTKLVGEEKQLEQSVKDLTQQLEAAGGANTLAGYKVAHKLRVAKSRLRKISGELGRSKKQPEKSFTSLIQSYGGIDPNSHAFKGVFSGVQEALENGVPIGVFKKGGNSLDGLAQELENDGHIRVPPGRNAPDYLMEVIQKQVGQHLVDVEQQYKQYEEQQYADYLQARRDHEQSVVEEAVRVNEEAGHAEGQTGPLEEGTGGHRGTEEENERGDAWEPDDAANVDTSFEPPAEQFPEIPPLIGGPTPAPRIGPPTSPQVERMERELKPEDLKRQEIQEPSNLPPLTENPPPQPLPKHEPIERFEPPPRPPEGPDVTKTPEWKNAARDLHDALEWRRKAPSNGNARRAVEAAQNKIEALRAKGQTQPEPTPAALAPEPKPEAPRGALTPAGIAAQQTQDKIQNAPIAPSSPTFVKDAADALKAGIGDGSIKSDYDLVRTVDKLGGGNVGAGIKDQVAKSLGFRDWTEITAAKMQGKANVDEASRGIADLDTAEVPRGPGPRGRDPDEVKAGFGRRQK